MTDLRRRTFATLEFRHGGDLGEGVARAYVTDYTATYPIGFGFMERIDPGAFVDSIKEDRAFPIFWEHDWDAGPIGTQTFESDKRGLLSTETYFVADDTRARGIFRSMQAGAIRERSIGFIPEVIERTEQSDKTTLELIKRGELVEASVVVKGANPKTEQVESRSECAKCRADAEARAAAEREAENRGVVIPPELLARISESRVRAIIRDILAH